MSRSAGYMAVDGLEVGSVVYMLYIGDGHSCRN